MLNTYIRDIWFGGMELFEPGETHVVVSVRFLKQAAVEKYMNVRQQWFINEGGRTLGVEEILEVLKMIRIVFRLSQIFSLF